MIPASVQTTADTSAFWPYALAAAGFAAAFLLFGWICTGGPQRLLNRWVAAKHVLADAERFCREADRQAQR